MPSAFLRKRGLRLLMPRRFSLRPEELIDGLTLSPERLSIGTMTLSVSKWKRKLWVVVELALSRGRHLLRDAVATVLTRAIKK
jgi:hypothetical protein